MRIYLRPFEEYDVNETTLGWLNDDLSGQFILASGWPVDLQSLRQYYLNSRPPDAVFFAICEIGTDKHIGNARLGFVDLINRHARYGRLIGDPKYRGIGLGAEVLDLLCKIAFYKLNLNRIWSAANITNEASLKSNKKFGMVEEGVLREFIFYQGEYIDAVILSMLKRDYEKLKR